MFNTLGSSTDALRRLIPVASFTVVLAAMTLVISGCSGGGGGFLRSFAAAYSISAVDSASSAFCNDSIAVCLCAFALCTFVCVS